MFRRGPSTSGRVPITLYGRVINLADMIRPGLAMAHSLPSINEANNHCSSQILFLGHQLLM